MSFESLESAFACYLQGLSNFSREKIEKGAGSCSDFQQNSQRVPAKALHSVCHPPLSQFGLADLTADRGRRLFSIWVASQSQNFLSTQHRAQAEVWFAIGLHQISDRMNRNPLLHEEKCVWPNSTPLGSLECLPGDLILLITPRLKARLTIRLKPSFFRARKCVSAGLRLRLRNQKPLDVLSAESRLVFLSRAANYSQLMAGLRSIRACLVFPTLGLKNLHRIEFGRGEIANSFQTARTPRKPAAYCTPVRRLVPRLPDSQLNE